MGLSDGEGNGSGSRAVESARGPSSELAHSRPRITFENVSASWPCQKARENGQSVGILLLGINRRRFGDLFHLFARFLDSRHNILYGASVVLIILKPIEIRRFNLHV